MPLKSWCHPLREFIWHYHKFLKSLAIIEALKIPENLQIHKIKRSFNLQGVPLIEFYKLSNGKLPYHTHYYGKQTDPDVFSHHELNVDENTCRYCFRRWRENEKKKWLQCLIYTYWYLLFP